MEGSKFAEAFLEPLVLVFLVAVEMSQDVTEFM